MAARGITEKLPDEVTGKNVRPARGEDAFEIVKTRIGFPRAEFTGGIHCRRGRAALGLRVVRAPTTNGIEGLETEAERINLPMAFGAGRIGPVFREPLAHGGGSAHVRLDRGNHIRRRRGFDTENVFRDPNTARHGRGFHPVRADREHSRHAEQTAPLVVALDTDPLETVGDAEGLLLGQVVELGQSLVGKGVVGLEKLPHRSVFLQQMTEKETDLRLHRFGQVFGVIHPRGFTRGRHAAEVA